MYYLQSRYYDPKICRFINADSYTSTGQGALGYNMFIYCLSNPVNGCDPCGTCFHRWDFWNDCEECGGKTFGEKVQEAFTTIKECNEQQALIQTQITMEQNKMIADAAKATWAAYMRSYNLHQESQRMEAQMVANTSPRIIEAGVKGGIEAVIFAVTYNEIEKHMQNADPKSTAAVVGMSFAAGFVAGATMEIWNILEEAILS